MNKRPFGVLAWTAVALAMAATTWLQVSDMESRSSIAGAANSAALVYGAFGLAVGLRKAGVRYAPAWTVFIVGTWLSLTFILSVLASEGSWSAVRARCVAMAAGMSLLTGIVASVVARSSSRA